MYLKVLVLSPRITVRSVKAVSQQNWHVGANMEMMRRLKNSTETLNVSIKQFNKASDKWALILIFLTLVMLIAVVFQIILALP